jgi:hypothetical protein
VSDGLLFCLHLRYRSDSDKTTALRQLKIITSHHSKAGEFKGHKLDGTTWFGSGIIIDKLKDMIKQ